MRKLLLLFGLILGLFYCSNDSNKTTYDRLEIVFIRFISNKKDTVFITDVKLISKFENLLFKELKTEKDVIIRATPDLVFNFSKKDSKKIRKAEILENSIFVDNKSYKYSSDLYAKVIELALSLELNHE